jgi:hypothetical protein
VWQTLPCFGNTSAARTKDFDHADVEPAPHPVQKNHYYTDSMQHFLDMLMLRMFGNTTPRDATSQQYLRNAQSNLASAGISVTLEELEMLAAKKKQVGN